jgi:hypothetical protein
MNKHVLKKRVNKRKHELEEESAKLKEINKSVFEFVSDIKSRSVIYNLIKNLPLWHKLEEWLDSVDGTGE